MKSTIQKPLEDLVSQSLADSGRQEFLILQQKAQKFLTNIKNYSDLFESSTKRIAYTSIRANLSKVYSLMKKDIELTQNLILEAHNFEGAVNEFLNRTMYLTYVQDDGTILFLDEAHTGDLYRTATANAGRGNIGKDKINNFNDLVEELNNVIQKSVAKNKPIYKNALNRWEKKNFGYRKHFYYQLEGKWYPSRRVRTKGRIAEAYVQLVVDNNTTVDKEYGLYLLDSRIDIDNIPAVVKGDVVFDESGNVHFAVKEGSFSTAKISSYYYLALNIVAIKNPPSKEEFQQALPKLVRISQTADKIIEKMNQEVETDCKDIAEAFQ